MGKSRVGRNEGTDGTDPNCWGRYCGDSSVCPLIICPLIINFFQSSCFAVRKSDLGPDAWAQIKKAVETQKGAGPALLFGWQSYKNGCPSFPTEGKLGQPFS
jgi:hypothetical protein